jgi:hypothetical protein
MRHVTAPRCRFKCRLLPITDNLWLCPHASWGDAVYQLGAEEEGRRLMDKAGGYDVLLAKIMDAEDERKRHRRIDDEHRRDQAAAAVRYR